MESVVFFIFQYETVVLAVPFRNHLAENPEEMLVRKKKGGGGGEKGHEMM